MSGRSHVEFKGRIKFIIFQSNSCWRNFHVQALRAFFFQRELGFLPIFGGFSLVFFCFQRIKQCPGRLEGVKCEGRACLVSKMRVWREKWTENDTEK